MAPFCPWEKACPVSVLPAPSAPPRRGEGLAAEIPPGRMPVLAPALGAHRMPPCPRLLYWCCRLGEREAEPGLEGRELPPGACRAWGSSCGPARLGSPGPDSSLLSSFWLLCCSGHSKWTQWNTWQERAKAS